MTRKEQSAILNEMTRTIKRDIDGPVSKILLNLFLIFGEERKLDGKSTQRLGLIQKELFRIRDVLQKLERIKKPKLIDYLEEIKIIDLNSSILKATEKP